MRTKRAELEQHLRNNGLFLSGVVNEPNLLPAGSKSLALISPDEPQFWDVFKTSAEYLDGSPDPIDRWSTRVITKVASQFEGDAIFPFGGPPFSPFLRFVEASDRGFSSPFGLIVHSERGLMISYRGAIALPFELASNATAHPCNKCVAKPCLSACPVDAFAKGFYDTDPCKNWLNSQSGTVCRENGCAIRRSCPLSTQPRTFEQSIHHMSYFTK